MTGENTEITIHEGSGNVFADLGFDRPEVELAKARLSGMIAQEVAARGWTQQQAAESLGIDQPRVCRLIAGKTGQFSLERLIECLERLNFDVRVEATPARDHSRGRLLVAV